jgi:shikimate kinase
LKTNIVLIGFMGAGKTTVSKALAEKTGKEFIELDDLIVKRAGKPITRIFDEDGEICFREFEIAVTKEIAGSENRVIATGGGIVLNRINIDRLKQNGVIVCLTVSPSEILKRTAADDSRPLLNMPDKESRIKELITGRKPFYERAADITVNTSRRNIDSIVSEIMKRLGEDEYFHL